MKSTDLLSACAAVQSERAKQYDASGTGERSFAAAASAFNALTGHELKGSDVCLLLVCLKLSGSTATRRGCMMIAC